MGVGDAAVGGHHAQFATDLVVAQAVVEPLDVLPDLGSDERVQRGRGEALELAKLRRHEGRGRDESVRHHLLDDRLGALLVLRVEVGEQEADGDRLDALRLQFHRGLAHGGLVQRHDLLAGRRDQPPRDGLAVAALDQRTALPGQFLHDRIVLDALVAGDVDDVAEALIGDETGLCALVFEHRIRGGRRAVEDIIDVGDIDAVFGAKLQNASHHALRGIVRRRGDLVDCHLARFHVAVNEVREGAPHVDAYRFHPTTLARLPISSRRR